MRTIAVEIKSFVRRSFINEFHGAVGQYLNYRGALLDNGISRDMILAVSSEIYHKMQKIGFVQNRLREFKIILLVINIETESIEKWIR